MDEPSKVEGKNSTGKIIVGGVVAGILLLNPITWIILILVAFLIAYAVFFVLVGGTVGGFAIFALVHDHPFLFSGLFVVAISLPLLHRSISNQQRIKQLEERLASIERKE